MYKSLIGQMIYVVITGLQLTFIPNTLLTLFGFVPTSEVWIRVLGLLVIALTPYYYNIAKYGPKPVVRATVQGRFFFCAGLVTLFLLNMAPLPIVGFALLEAGLTAWTAWELRRSQSVYA